MKNDVVRFATSRQQTELPLFAMKGIEQPVSGLVLGPNGQWFIVKNQGGSCKFDADGTWSQPTTGLPTVAIANDEDNDDDDDNDGDGFDYQMFDVTGGGVYPTSVLIPNRNASNFVVPRTKNNNNNTINNCTSRPDRVIYFTRKPKGGLTDRTGKILIMAMLGCQLQARVLVGNPHELLTPNHNFGKPVAPSVIWDDYVKFPTFVLDDDDANTTVWKLCPDRTILQDTAEVSAAKALFQDPSNKHKIVQVQRIDSQNTRDLLMDAMKRPEKKPFIKNWI